ncbi:hypothetical protein Y032_0001g49 [Ancylostoma ceylanicum]|uniref:Uncharacterized protein n=1 Tax=Ancylostoma ceylanicum TaxID=53326 RepID=A0A016W6I7_9BILA|nr:hypothetical protein Y032_0001g49 [Ancylostoma ceylanicum]
MGATSNPERDQKYSFVRFLLEVCSADASSTSDENPKNDSLLMVPDDIPTPVFGRHSILHSHRGSVFF